MAAVLREVISLVLVVGLVVTGTALLVMFTGHGGPGRPRHRRDYHRQPQPALHPRPPGPRPTPLANTPASAVAAARARALHAAEQILPLEPIVETPGVAPREPLALPPASTPPAGQPDEEPDVPVRRLDPSAEELRSAIDRLIETNPDFLAEVITKWIRDDSGTKETGQRPPSGGRRPTPRHP